MKIKNVIIMLGPPGSGKGTQGKMLASLFNYAYFSMGSRLREYARLDTELARDIKVAIDSGKIIPDEWIRKLFREKISSLPNGQGLVLDGFPRDLGQIGIFNDFLVQEHVETLKVLFLDVPEAKLIARITDRRSEQTRVDDDPNVVGTRFKEYTEKTLPLKNYFEQKGVLLVIDGNHSITDVHNQIVEKLKRSPDIL